MLITFSYPSGRSVTAVVMAVGTDSIRVVVPKYADGLDLFLYDTGWVTEAGIKIRMDAILLGEEPITVEVLGYVGTTPSCDDASVSDPACRKTGN